MAEMGGQGPSYEGHEGLEETEEKGQSQCQDAVPLADKHAADYGNCKAVHSQGKCYEDVFQHKGLQS